MSDVCCLCKTDSCSRSHAPRSECLLGREGLSAFKVCILFAFIKTEPSALLHQKYSFFRFPLLGSNDSDDDDSSGHNDDNDDDSDNVQCAGAGAASRGRK